jgi:excisionase family DNA binding protein
VDQRITVNEAARRLGVSRRTVYMLIAERKLTADKFRHRTCLWTEELTAFANGIETEALLLGPDVKTWGYVQPEDEVLFLRAVTAAKRIGISRQRLLQLIQAREIPAFNIGRCVVLRPVDVAGYGKHRKTEHAAKLLERLSEE